MGEGGRKKEQKIEKWVYDMLMDGYSSMMTNKETEKEKITMTFSFLELLIFVDGGKERIFGLLGVRSLCLS